MLAVMDPLHPSGAEPPGAHPPPPRRRPRHHLTVSLLLGGLRLGLSGTAAALYITAVRAPATLAGLRLGGEPLSAVPQGELRPRVHQIAERFLGHRLRLRAGGEVVRARLGDLGL